MITIVICKKTTTITTTTITTTTTTHKKNIIIPNYTILENDTTEEDKLPPLEIKKVYKKKEKDLNSFLEHQEHQDDLDMEFNSDFNHLLPSDLFIDCEENTKENKVKRRLFDN
jgi:hypothetical protein